MHKLIWSVISCLLFHCFTDFRLTLIVLIAVLLFLTKLNIYFTDVADKKIDQKKLLHMYLHNCICTYVIYVHYIYTHETRRRNQHRQTTHTSRLDIASLTQNKGPKLFKTFPF